MNKNVKDGREDVCPVKIFGMMIPILPSLIFRLTALFIRFKSDANKAGKVFKSELIKQGINEVIASELTGVYLRSSHIRNYIKGFN
jgi:hypothetical protein